MQGARTSDGSQSSSLFASALTASHSLFTPKRVGFTLAGAFVFVGTAAALASSNNGQETNAAPRTMTVQSSASDAAQPEPSSDTDPASSAEQTEPSPASSTSSTNIQVNVNGQAIDVPENGSVHETVPTTDGTGQSSVSVDSSASSSSSSLNLNISSSSTSSGNGSSRSSTTVRQHGGTTIISNH